MFRKQATPPQFSIFTTFAFGRGLRLAVLVMVLGLNVRMVESAELMYVAIGGNNTNLPPDGYLATFDVSLNSASAIAASKSTFSTSFNEPFAVAMDRSGQLYASDYFGNISKISLTGQTTIFAAISATKGMAFDSSGNLYASTLPSVGNSKVYKITASGQVSVFAQGLYAAEGIAFDPSGNLFVANAANSTINKITPDGQVSNFSITGINGPADFAFDTIGNMYISNYYGNSIFKYDTSGNLSTFISGIVNPSTIEFDSYGSLFVVNGTTTISKFNANGNLQYSWNTGGAYARGIAFQPVPEPSTYVLGLIAAGAIGFVARCRKRQQNQA